MESGGDSLLRARCRAFSQSPTFSDLDSSLDGDCNLRGNGNNNITSNGERNNLYLLVTSSKGDDPV